MHGSGVLGAVGEGRVEPVGVVCSAASVDPDVVEAG